MYKAAPLPRCLLQLDPPRHLLSLWTAWSLGLIPSSWGLGCLPLEPPGAPNVGLLPSPTPSLASTPVSKVEEAIKKVADVQQHQSPARNREHRQAKPTQITNPDEAAAAAQAGHDDPQAEGRSREQAGTMASLAWRLWSAYVQQLKCSTNADTVGLLTPLGHSQGLASSSCPAPVLGLLPWLGWATWKPSRCQLPLQASFSPGVIVQIGRAHV